MASYSFGILSHQQYVTAGSGTGTPGVFTPVYDRQGELTSFSNCQVMFGREMVYGGTIEAPGTNGTLYAKITHPTYGQSSNSDDGHGAELELTMSGGSSTNLVTYIPIYYLSNGRISRSYLGMPVIPVYN